MAAKMSVSEKDFDLLAACALEAEARGDMETAVAADRLARRINAALSVSANRDAAYIVRAVTGGEPKNFTWRDVPTLLGKTTPIRG